MCNTNVFNKVSFKMDFNLKKILVTEIIRKGVMASAGASLGSPGVEVYSTFIKLLYVQNSFFYMNY